jgi:hypothetical protein
MSTHQPMHSTGQGVWVPGIIRMGTTIIYVQCIYINGNEMNFHKFCCSTKI